MLSGEDVLLTVYRAFNARDIEPVLAAMHPDVDWPNGWEGGRIHGRDAVREYWMRQWSVINPRVEPLRFHPDDSNRIIVDVHALVHNKNDEIIADEIIQHIYIIEEGLIRSMEIRKPKVSSPAAR